MCVWQHNKNGFMLNIYVWVTCCFVHQFRSIVYNIYSIVEWWHLYNIF